MKSFGPVYTQPNGLNEEETSEIFNHTGWRTDAQEPPS
jgi:hypothetical protein